MSIINDTPNSKLHVLTNNPDGVLKLDVEKGKTKTPETTEERLDEIIDVKGMRAQGNRLSTHAIKKFELLTPEIDLAALEESKKESEKEEAEAKSKEEKPANKDGGKEDKESSKKKDDSVSLEITNPDDVNIDNNGQMGLF